MGRYFFTRTPSQEWKTFDYLTANFGGSSQISLQIIKIGAKKNQIRSISNFDWNSSFWLKTKILVLSNLSIGESLIQIQTKYNLNQDHLQISSKKKKEEPDTLVMAWVRRVAMRVEHRG